MANGIFGWSTSPSGNATQDSINFAEGQLPSTVNDSARGLMSIVAKYLKDIGGSNAAGGSANAITVTTVTSVTSYATGMVISFKAASDNSGATTFNANSLGAKNVYVNGVACAGGEIKSGAVYWLAYDATLNSSAGGWHLLNPAVTVDPTLSGIAALTPTANQIIYATGADTFATTGLTAFIRTLLDDADAATALTTLGAQPSATLLSSLAALSVVSGDVIYGSGTGAVARLAKGTDGQVLTLASGLPSWGAAPGWTQVGTWDYSAATTTLDFTGLGSYSEIMVVGKLLTGTISITCRMRLSPDGGTTWRTTGYIAGFGGYDFAGSSGCGLEATDGVPLSQFNANQTNISFCARLTCFNQALRTSVSVVSGKGSSSVAGVAGAGHGLYDTAEAHNALRILMGANITGGYLRVYGRN